ncbi:unnamed protein product [Effrenium voratum]|uniref:NYN domain-containing protein n=1 Tax=Effrenium voratum TaxID=2562239 RepID=A0AA36IWQ3_9DINO|nr:unnamed protein product [Effrenium voratum]
MSLWASQRSFKFRFARLTRRFSQGLTHLLVDADSQNIEHIKSAMRVFQGQQLQVTVFAPPLQSQNKKWGNFFESKGVRFQAVDRVGGMLDPTDEAIKSAALRVADDQGTRCVALLTNDSGFVELVRQVRSAGKECVVIMQKHLSYSARLLYEGEHARTIILEPPQRAAEVGVRAVLEADGRGKVSLEQHLDTDELTDQAIAEARSFLQRWKFAGEQDMMIFELVAPIAKFWYQHSLGPIPVFPGWLAGRSLHHLLTHTAASARWQTHSNDFAFVLPRGCSTGRLSQRDLRTYGNSTSKSIFLGGGPFIVPNSQDMVLHVLQNLGYWDTYLNNDHIESMKVFINNTRNKRNLRKQCALPDVSDTPAEMMSKIRVALLSGNGQWRRAPEDTAVKSMLMSKGLIKKDDGQRELFEAMRDYARLEQLPEMSTYNGYVWRILGKLSARDPNRRDTF